MVVCAEERWPEDRTDHDAFADFFALTDDDKVTADLRVGRPGQLARASLSAGLLVMQPVVDAIALAVERSGTWTRAEDAALEALAGFRESAALSAMVSLPSSKGDLAGQIMVHGHEVKLVSLADGGDDPATFMEMPWDEAIAEFRARGIMSNADLDTLLRDYRERGTNARQMLLEELRLSVHDMIATAMTEGQSFRQFRKAVDQHIDTLGITPANPAYLETVFRTNVQTAYGAGRWRAMTSPEVVAQRPLWQYRAVGDGRTRKSHLDLNGLVFEIGNPDTDRLAPPGGFNCRCASVSLASVPSGITVLRAVPAGCEPDEGFGKPPTRDITLKSAA